MGNRSRYKLKNSSFFMLIIIALLMILNIVYGSIEALPKLPDFTTFNKALIYSVSFISVLIHGESISIQYILTGIFLVIILPSVLLVMVFRKRVIKTVLFVTAYFLLLSGISVLLPALGIHPEVQGNHRILTMFFLLINYPFGLVFYLLYLLTGAALYPLPGFLLTGATIRRYWTGKQAHHVILILIWGYVEVILFIATLSLFHNEVYGGVIVEALGNYMAFLGGKALMIIILCFSLFEFLLFASKTKHKKLIKTIKKSISGLRAPRRVERRRSESTVTEQKPVPSFCLEFGRVAAPDIETSSNYNIRNPITSSNNSNKQIENSTNEESRHARERIDSIIHDLDLPLSIEESFKGPSFYLFIYSITRKGTLKQIKRHDGELTFRLKEYNTRPIIPLPEKARIGFITERRNKEMVLFSDKSDQLHKRREILPLYLGKTLTGEDLFTDLTRHPHLLVGGATGAGKSIFLHVLLQSLLFSSNRKNLRLVLVDPKRVEFSPYKNSNHLACPILEDLKDIDSALSGLVAEMEKRYQRLKKRGRRDITSFNISSTEKMSYVVVVIDEAADILLQDNGSIKQSIILLTQKARAVGIHVVLATQRPSADVVDGLIKANFPVRIAFKTASATDSRIIIEENGAEELIGCGDGLFMESGKPVRFQGAYYGEGA